MLHVLRVRLIRDTPVNRLQPIHFGFVRHGLFALNGRRRDTDQFAFMPIRGYPRWRALRGWRLLFTGRFSGCLTTGFRTLDEKTRPAIRCPGCISARKNPPSVWLRGGL